VAELTPLLCFAPAGAGASFYTGWAEPARDAGFALTALDLPGRERRFTDPPVHSVAEAAHDVLPRAAEIVTAAGAGVLLGHCLGAWVAYHLARLLISDAAVPPQRLLLCASGSAVPGEVLGLRATGQPDEEFLRRVAENTGFTHPAFADEELRELLLPALRADVEAAESYAPPWADPVAFPVLTWRADADRLVPSSAVARWITVTDAFAGAVEYPGGHMSLPEQGPALLPGLAATWRSLTHAAAPASSGGERS
jgi:surfactin synthase thioesterase subunit